MWSNHHRSRSRVPWSLNTIAQHSNILASSQKLFSYFDSPQVILSIDQLMAWTGPPAAAGPRKSTKSDTISLASLFPKPSSASGADSAETSGGESASKADPAAAPSESGSRWSG